MNTVNTLGVMGKGIALQFKKAYPNNFKAYKDVCDKGEVEVGKMFVQLDSNLETGEKIIVNFPTKKNWRKPSEYIYVEQGLDNLIHIVEQYDIKSIAIPPLGAGNGGLQWEQVRKIIEKKLSQLPIEIIIYEPNNKIVDQLKKERIKLTKARALLLYVLFDLVKNGEYVSEFSSEKVCYFLQKFGAQSHFKLKFEPQFYGPYSGKVRYVLNALNGSYLMGYSDMNKKPFEPLTLIGNSHESVVTTISKDEELTAIANKTTQFLTGFYSDFSLELLSSLDFLSDQNNTLDKAILSQKLQGWSNRKRTLFSNPRYLEIALRHLEKFKKGMI